MTMSPVAWSGELDAGRAVFLRDSGTLMTGVGLAGVNIGDPSFLFASSFRYKTGRLSDCDYIIRYKKYVTDRFQENKEGFFEKTDKSCG